MSAEKQMDDLVVGISQQLDEFETNTKDEYQKTSEALFDLVMSRAKFKVSICKNKLESNRVSCGNCDGVFAIQSKYPETLLCKVVIGGQFVHEVTLVPNSIEWILNGCPIFVISIQYHEVRLDFYTLDGTKVDTTDMYVYGLLFDTNERRILAVNGGSHDVSRKYYVQYHTGMAHIDKQRVKTPLHFNRRVSLEDIRNIRPRTEEFVKKIKEELMERTWHPSRYMEWCWDEDEKASLMEDTA